MSRPMRVVDVTSFFSESCGGIKTYYREKAEYLPRRGVECHFVVPGRWASEEPLGGGMLHRLPGPSLPGNGQYRLFGRAAALGALIDRLKPDVIEVGSHYRLPRIVGRLDVARKAVVAGFFHSDIAGTLVAPLLRRWPVLLSEAVLARVWRWVRKQHDRYDVTLVASRTVARMLRDHGVPRVYWVGLGVDVDVFRPSPRTSASAALRLVYAGRLSPDKGIAVLCKAMDQIHQRTGAELHVAGEGPDRPQLQRLGRTRPYLHVHGHIDDRKQLARMLASADVAITPGATETFSLGTAEAMACGVPVVAADSGGAGELVSESRGGLLFAAGSSRSLAAAVIDLMERPAAARARMGEAGRAHVLQVYTWPAVMDRLLAAYQSRGAA